ncbi:hypothetical protein [Methylomonas sp. AM2-LC]|uniref:hypothetical protein n=1 Tax=Methylomonas sp. AM2-LC TaxID=3153301 RepID=UPI0032630E2D
MPQKLINVLILISFTVFISSCASKPKALTAEEQSEKLADALVNGGYVSASNLAINSVREVWRHDAIELDIMMTAPTASGSYPLVIYLPSLGEDASAARLWREAWAKAGYAVFSMQPLSIGQALKELKPEQNKLKNEDKENEIANDDSPDDVEDGGWFSSKKDRKPSGNDRASELRYLGHEYFAIDSLKNRMEQLFWAYQQLKVRANLQVPLFANANFSKVVLVGYDLGAQTVAGVLGEEFKATLPTNTELKPLAAIALSPSIDLAEGNVRNRFQKLHLPMLVITGSEDNDPYAISSASVRSAMWEFAPAGGKYLLLLKGAVHPLLAGSNMGGGRDRSIQGPNDEMRGGRGLLQLSNQYGAGGNHGHDGGFPGGFMDDKSKERDAGLAYKQVAAVLSTSSAFLDLVVKNDQFAQYWMQDKAIKWLDKAGSLSVR